jgi:hypothetical protein
MLCHDRRFDDAKPHIDNRTLCGPPQSKHGYVNFTVKCLTHLDGNILQRDVSDRQRVASKDASGNKTKNKSACKTLVYG